MNNFFTREFYFTNEINRKRNLKIHNVQLVAKKKTGIVRITLTHFYNFSIV
jgi:nitrate reductase cytochrome c-type subunit